MAAHRKDTAAAERHTLWRRKQESEGKCVECHRDAAPGRTRCYDHLERAAQAAKRFRSK